MKPTKVQHVFQGVIEFTMGGERYRAMKNGAVMEDEVQS